MVRMPFLRLFSGAFRLYVSRFKVSVAYSLLCIFIPRLFAGVMAWALPYLAGYIASPNLELQEILRAALSGIGSSIGSAILLAVSFIAMPLNTAMQLNLYSRAKHGQSLDFRGVFDQVKGRAASAMGINLICYLFATLLLIGLSLLGGVWAVASSMQSGNNGVLGQNYPFSWSAYLIFLSISHCYLMVSQCAILSGVNEGVWGFAAIKRAFLMIGKRAGTAAGGFLLFVCMKALVALLSYIVVLPSQAAAILQIGFTLLPTFILCFIYPLENAFFTMLYYDLRVAREGFAPLADADSPQQSLLDEGDGMQ